MNLKVALAQYPIVFHKSCKEYQRHYRSWVLQAKNQSPDLDLVVFPEYGSLDLMSLFPQSLNNLQLSLEKIQEWHALFLDWNLELAKEFNIVLIAPSFPFWNGVRFVNRVYVCTPSGRVHFQDKQRMTRFETEEWGISSGDPGIKVFDLKGFRFAIAICFDCEFPDLYTQVSVPVHGWVIPSCTDSVAGWNRVHIGARARSLEMQNYSLVSQTVGDSFWCPAVDVNRGFAAVYGPPDTSSFSFENGIFQRGREGTPEWVFAKLSLHKPEYWRTRGNVFLLSQLETSSHGPIFEL